MVSGIGPIRVFPVFVGCGRSGTTLIRNIFDAHTELAVTHEAHFMAPMTARRARYEREEGFDVDGFAADLEADANYRRQGLDHAVVVAAIREGRPSSTPDAVRLVFAEYASLQGKPLYGDKTPGSVNHVALLGSVYPETRFVHLIRDGRAVALSYLERPEWGPRSVGEAAFHWRSRVARGREGGQSLEPHRYTEVKYEQLVDDPEPEVRRIAEFLGLDFQPAMLRYHERAEEFIATTKDPDAFRNLSRPVTRGMRDWRQEMSSKDVGLFDAIAGDWLEELGYDVAGKSAPAATTVRVLGAGLSWQLKRVMSRMPRANRVRSVER